MLDLGFLEFPPLPNEERPRSWSELLDEQMADEEVDHTSSEPTN